MDEVLKRGTTVPISVKKVAFTSLIGTTIEWYDFFIYGTASALVFNKMFFPNLSPTIGTMAAFATFGVAFVARPVGGIIFGHFGDRIGRKASLVMTLVIMGGSTVGVGLLPSYESIGFMAPLLLVTLRFLQGFAVGGEWGGALIMAFEYAPSNRRTFYTSWPQLGSGLGLILSTSVFSLFALLPDGQFLVWGWRVPFLASIVLIAVGLFVRLRILESPEFHRIQESNSASKVPGLEVLRTNLVGVLLCFGMFFFSLGAYYVFTSFTLNYATTQLGVARDVVLVGLLAAAGSQLLGTLLFAWIADRFGRTHLALLGCPLFALLFAFPFFWLVDTGNMVLIWIAMFLISASNGGFYGVAASFVTGLFDARVRYSGLSLGLQGAAVVAGAPAPLIATGLLAWSGGKSWPIAAWIALTAMVTLVSTKLALNRAARIAANVDQGTPSPAAP
jgi:MFS family permease